MPAVDAWEDWTLLPAIRSGHMSFMYGNWLYVLGGRSTASLTSGILDSMLRYDTSANGNAWQTEISPGVPLATMPAPRFWAAGALIGDTYYLAGGRDAAGLRVRTFWSYHVPSNTWTTGLPLLPVPAGSTGRDRHRCFVLNGKLYAVGGNHSGTTAHGLNSEYTPGGAAWVARTALPSNRYDGVAAEINGLGHYLGGQAGGGTVSGAHWSYDAVANAWTARAAETAFQQAVGMEADDAFWNITGEGGGNSDRARNARWTMDAWVAKTSIPVVRRYASGDVSPIGNIHVVGGESGTSNPSNHHQVYGAFAPPVVEVAKGTWGRVHI